MITWDYRVFQETNGDYVIREVFYDEGIIVGCTENPVEPFGRTIENLAQSIRDFQHALTLPVLTLDEMPPATNTAQKRSRSQTTSHEQLRAKLGLVDTPAASG